MRISLFILDIVNDQLETIDRDYNIDPKKTEEKNFNYFWQAPNRQLLSCINSTFMFLHVN